MTKAMICATCFDIVAPYRENWPDGHWRQCECGTSAVRWRDGYKGQLQVSAVRKDQVRVLGLNNSFLAEAIQQGRELGAPDWRSLHERSAADVGSHYLFHKDRRACWALVIWPGQTGDVEFVPWGDAMLRIAPAPGWAPTPAELEEFRVSLDAAVAPPGREEGGPDGAPDPQALDAPERGG